MYAKSRNASVKSNATIQQSTQLQHYRTAEPPNYNKLEKEYKEVMRSLR